MAFINGQITVVKLIRAFHNFDLRTCKIISELWEDAFDNNYVTDNYAEILKLGSICKMIESGDWFIEQNQVIMTKQIATGKDVLKLFP